MPTTPLSKVVAVLRAPSADRYRPVVDALVAGGVREIELTLTTPGTLDVVSRLRADVGDIARIGVGTVTDGVLARAALDAGARFLVTPGIVRAAAEPAHEHGVPVIMGALTPTEVMTATASGADLVKIFPASAVGAEYLEQLRGPFPDLRAVPSGGIGAAEARAWLAAGAAAVSMGGPLIGDALNGGSLRTLTDRMRRLAEAIGEDVIT
ncbi:bifunctional 4-hydroxy-2-oxoglutarate aldolase/2-dehydro-3-deoxy-phosphogluconate aldolase [Streptomyces sp. RY43-2]|uniref:Bifunctional 4-hydroxy-2-oxoglutarate aldolase/2-dehydro-3-deoxy-phosphogluconate aldolase n=1 Tax=Streptomyces macrolidinus TaxID=2952607 RepID=A0ABT0ZJI2_9ACTN|nr:bifunctional 4-hydroxy-2-oxoglutarate aldolase/2-dehydro-3-deoxy-phosphogluconate aldolase [Streptomyces macrolidinus]MCN9243753.1 bifunctional 4-hydroxy-2-oxoglutarate aldolase/2-dehydro-3-deoxy-phosphogluconate aldolase [Streptomyces macrolidinus]